MFLLPEKKSRISVLTYFPLETKFAKIVSEKTKYSFEIDSNKNRNLCNLASLNNVETTFSDLLQCKVLKITSQPKSVKNELKRVIEIPNEIRLSVQNIEQSKFLNFKTERGTLNYKWPKEFLLSVKKTDAVQSLQLICPEQKLLLPFYSNIRAIYQILIGVSKGHKQRLKIVGVGYKAVLEGEEKLRISLGYSHHNYYQLYPTVQVKFSRKNNRLHLSGSSLSLVTGTAATLHSFKKPDVYKGKGVRYRGLKLIKKEGKKKK
jgi:large subunit ribosomal protein L6